MTDLYAVIGNPIVQSKSPAIHKAFAEQTGEDLDYVAIEGDVEGFAAEVGRWRERGLKGLNITAPSKLDAFAYATRLRDSARRAGAVNCLTFREEGIVEGANYDGVGLVRDIAVNLNAPVRGKRFLLLGAGGAARGAIGAILDEQPSQLVLAFRTPHKAERLVEEFSGSGPIAAVDYASLRQAADGGFDIVVNATSAGLFGAAPPTPPEIFEHCALAYDMTYGKGLTPFLKIARDGGAERIADGTGMLVEQAAEAFLLWRGIRPSTAGLIKNLSVPLT